MPEPDTLVIEDEALRKGFTSAPNYILDDSGVSIAARFTYIVLLSFAWRAGSCFPGQARLAKTIGVTDRAVRNYLGELIEKGYIRVSRRGLGKTNIYHILKVTPQIEAERNACSVPERNTVSPPERHGLSHNEALEEKEAGRIDSDHSKVREDETPLAAAESEGIARIMEKLSKHELCDAVHLRSNTTQAINLWRRSRLPAAEFVTLMHRAKEITLQNSGRIYRTVPGYRGTKNRAPYFFRVLRDVMQQAVLKDFKARFGKGL